jgi:hypothetical protein
MQNRCARESALRVPWRSTSSSTPTTRTRHAGTRTNVREVVRCRAELEWLPQLLSERRLPGAKQVEADDPRMTCPNAGSSPAVLIPPRLARPVLLDVRSSLLALCRMPSRPLDRRWLHVESARREQAALGGARVPISSITYHPVLATMLNKDGRVSATLQAASLCRPSLVGVSVSDTSA